MFIYFLVSGWEGAGGSVIKISKVKSRDPLWIAREAKVILKENLK